MPIYNHPQRHNVLLGNEASPGWNKWFGDLKNQVNEGEAPEGIQNIEASVGIKLPSAVTNIIIRIQSATAGDVNIPENPQIEFGFDGQVITLVGEDDIKTVTLHDGDGLKLDSSITLKENTNLVLHFNANKRLWIEQTRALT